MVNCVSRNGDSSHARLTVISLAIAIAIAVASAGRPRTQQELANELSCRFVRSTRGRGLAAGRPGALLERRLCRCSLMASWPLEPSERASEPQGPPQVCKPAAGMTLIGRAEKPARLTRAICKQIDTIIWHANMAARIGASPSGAGQSWPDLLESRHLDILERPALCHQRRWRPAGLFGPQHRRECCSDINLVAPCCCRQSTRETHCSRGASRFSLKQLDPLSHQARLRSPCKWSMEQDGHDQRNESGAHGSSSLIAPEDHHLGRRWIVSARSTSGPRREPRELELQSEQKRDLEEEEADRGFGTKGG